MSEREANDGREEARAELLAAVLDEIIPPSADGRLPGAGALGLASHVERAATGMPGLAEAISAGLSALDRIARGRSPGGFVALGGPERGAALADLAASDQAFLPTLTFLAYVAYYQSPQVVSALGLEPRPPHPKGYEMAEAEDPTLLEPVRARPRMYRDAGAGRS
jgi:Gluconate 2-dehydrogenase subunit 3